MYGEFSVFFERVLSDQPHFDPKLEMDDDVVWPSGNEFCSSHEELEIL